jgi:hypothetical protein
MVALVLRQLELVPAVSIGPWRVARTADRAIKKPAGQGLSTM